LQALILTLWMAQSAISGIVKDASGGVIPGASVAVTTGVRSEQRTHTGPDGRFAFESAASGPVTIVVRASGFAVYTQVLTALHDVTVVLSPATILETAIVTPSRGDQRLGDVPASVEVLDRTSIDGSAAVAADDVLRQIPTFSLFTRASSLSSHPTSQGVSLRGIGPSGVSRTLVLTDGIPENDPFGGWVYWTRVPLASVDQIEVVDGSSSSLYGNYAMGGVINIVTDHPKRQTLEVTPRVGNLGTRKVDFFGSDVWGKAGVAMEGDAFTTDGFPIVAASERGAVDNNASDAYRNVNVKFDYSPTSGVQTFLRAGDFHENRANGKHSTTDTTGAEEANDTTWRFVSGEAHIALPGGSAVQTALFSNVETFHSNFLAVPAASPPRSLARDTLNQAVPTNDVGGMAQWSGVLGRRNAVTAGADWHWVTGESQEDGLDATTGTQVVLHRVSGGTQQSIGAFVEDIWQPISRLTMTFAGRVDHFANYNAHNLENTVLAGVLGPPTVNNNPNLPEHVETVGTPRLGAVYHVMSRVNVWADVSSGFRAPTLNELYRQFKKGTTTTLANYALVPERLLGSEGGASLIITKNLTVRATMFDNRVTNPVTNVTIATRVTPTTLPTATATCTPSVSQICVQRQNLGRTAVDGFQTDVEFRQRGWRLAAGFVHEAATVRADAANPALVGNFLPEVPKNRGSVQIAYANPNLATIAFDLQGIGAQFDDDLNTPSRLLPSYATGDLTVSRTVTKHWDVFIGVQNIFNKTYVVATLPTTIGSPRLITAGVRLSLQGRPAQALK
jgi:outer membrane cobalamin receptor